MNIVFLMGDSYSDKNDYPLYLTEIMPGTLLEKQIQLAMNLTPQQLIFCMKASDIVRFHTDESIKQLVPGAIIVPIANKTKGAVCTALLAAGYIDNDEELILLAIDDFLEEDHGTILEFFRKNKADAGLIAFRSIHPRYSFVRLNEQEEVVEVAEKRPISQNALVSFYYYKRGREFVAAAKEMIRKDNSLEGAFYISETMNELILQQKKILLYKIKNENFYPIKTQSQLAEYIAEHRANKESK